MPCWYPTTIHECSLHPPQEWKFWNSENHPPHGSCFSLVMQRRDEIASACNAIIPGRAGIKPACCQQQFCSSLHQLRVFAFVPFSPQGIVTQCWQRECQRANGSLLVHLCGGTAWWCYGSSHRLQRKQFHLIEITSRKKLSNLECIRSIVGRPFLLHSCLSFLLNYIKIWISVPTRDVLNMWKSYYCSPELIMEQDTC